MTEKKYLSVNQISPPNQSTAKRGSAMESQMKEQSTISFGGDRKENDSDEEPTMPGGQSSAAEHFPTRIPHVEDHLIQLHQDPARDPSKISKEILLNMTPFKDAASRSTA
jgi:hypothetical protein